jgi:hypothetical protein
MFQFPRSASYYPMDSGSSPSPSRSGFPHSEISGSKFTYNSPEHIGVRPVLHRLLAPRHPPCALSSFSYYFLHGDTNFHLYHPVFATWRKRHTCLSLHHFLSNFQSTICHTQLVQFQERLNYLITTCPQKQVLFYCLSAVCVLLAATRNNITWLRKDCNPFLNLFLRYFFSLLFPC